MDINVSQSKEISENVKSPDFYKIYLYVSSHQFELEDSNLVGWIQVPNMYLDEQEFFRINYTDLDIDCTGEYYITFDDPICQKMVANVWGDYVGIIPSRAALFTGGEVTSQRTSPYNNVVSFNELQYFTKLKKLPKQLFYRFQEMESITFPSSL